MCEMLLFDQIVPKDSKVAITYHEDAVRIRVYASRTGPQWIKRRKNTLKNFLDNDEFDINEAMLTFIREYPDRTKTFYTQARANVCGFIASQQKKELIFSELFHQKKIVAINNAIGVGRKKHTYVVAPDIIDMPLKEKK
jgi:hypothetical protein